RLVGLEDTIDSLAARDCREFPRKVDRIADAGVHALATGRAVHVSRVAREKHPSLPEMARDAVMHLVGGKPFLLEHMDSDQVLDVRQDVGELDRRPRAQFFGYHTDQTETASRTDRE